jgi:hypothetical protein
MATVVYARDARDNCRFGFYLIIDAGASMLRIKSVFSE